MVGRRLSGANMTRSFCLISAAALLMACSDDPNKSNLNNEPDGGVNNNIATDGSTENANNSDGGANNVLPGDGGANNNVADMNAPDLPTGPTDFALKIDCSDSSADVYATPISPGEPGEVLACAVSEVATAAEVELRLIGIDGLTISTGYQSYLIAYRTTRATGEPGVGSMLLYAPSENVRDVAQSALVVANHGGAAVPDACAPSMVGQGFAGTNSLALPFVGRGYPVALPDFAGFGTEGVMGFANTIDLGQSALDAARAARNAFGPASLDARVLSIGQAEGASASYAMQALNSTYAADVTVAGAVGYATSYPRVSYAELLRLGGVFPLVDGLGILRTVAALVAYTDFYNLFGAARARDVFNTNVRDYVGDAVETQCFVELALTLATTTANYTPPVVIAGLIDDAFRMDVVNCLNQVPCGADAQTFVDRAAANIVPLDPAGGDLLFVSAFGGTTPNPQEQACLLEWIEQNGPTPTECLWSGANNVNISRQAASYAVDWGIATLEGDAPPACPEGPFPPCN